MPLTTSDGPQRGLVCACSTMPLEVSPDTLDLGMLCSPMTDGSRSTSRQVSGLNIESMGHVDLGDGAMGQTDSETRDQETDVRMFCALERIVRKRYGIALLVGLAGWPLLGFIPQFESIVVNGFLLDGYAQLAFLTLTSVVAFFFSFAILRLLNSRVPHSGLLQLIAGDGSAPWERTRMVIVLLMAMIAPTVLAFRFGSEFAPNGHAWRATATICASAAVALLGLFALGCLKSYLIGSDKRTANFFPFEAREKIGWVPWTSLSARLDRAKAFGIESIDVQLLIYLLLLGLAHGGMVRWIDGDRYWLTSAPSMFVLVIWLLFMTLAGIANVLDRWRLPVLPAIILLLAVLLGIRGSTRPIRTVDDRSNSKFASKVASIRTDENELLDRSRSMDERRTLISKATTSLESQAWQAIVKRMNEFSDAPKGKTLVVVTCPGGGIHAAAWAACVLDQLSEDYVEFKDSVCVISGVSGGSVGTLMFVSDRYRDAFLEAQELEQPNVEGPEPEQKSESEPENALADVSPALGLASRSSLEAIAFGISIDDLYGLVGIPGKGRGQRLEDSFASHLPPEQRELTIGDWGDRALDGKIPIVIFNATDAVTGRRILFDTIPTPRRASSVGLIARPLNYRELLATGDGYLDVRPVTAVRASATFPYVSPFVKPSQPSEVGSRVALCDGGYVDNEGIVTAVNWIEFLQKHWLSQRDEEERPFQRILLLRIRPSESVDQNIDSGASGLAGLFRWLTGPIETMANVRSASQMERGNLEADLASLDLINDDSLVASSSLPIFNRRTQSPGEIQKKWQEMIDEFNIKDLGIPIEEASTENPSFQATPTNQAEQDADKLSVIVHSIAFVDANQTIPLNWKLSSRQKKEYLLSWWLRSRPSAPLRQTLDRYFTRRRK